MTDDDSSLIRKRLVGRYAGQPSMLEVELDGETKIAVKFVAQGQTFSAIADPDDEASAWHEVERQVEAEGLVVPPGAIANFKPL